MSDFSTDSRMQPGTQVEVLNRLSGKWVSGFEVAETCDEGYRVRRVSDGTVLPAPLPPDSLNLRR
jgi:hypothetical protein